MINYFLKNYNLFFYGIQSWKKWWKKEKTSGQISDIKKIMQLNKVGALLLIGDKYEKAEGILKKTLDFYLEKKK